MKIQRAIQDQAHRLREVRQALLALAEVVADPSWPEDDDPVHNQNQKENTAALIRDVTVDLQEIILELLAIAQTAGPKGPGDDRKEYP